jgi:hypothetical protein
LAFMALCGFAAILALLLLVPHSHPHTLTPSPSEESTHEN